MAKATNSCLSCHYLTIRVRVRVRVIRIHFLFSGQHFICPRISPFNSLRVVYCNHVLAFSTQLRRISPIWTTGPHLSTKSSKPQGNCKRSTRKKKKINREFKIHWRRCRGHMTCPSPLSPRPDHDHEHERDGADRGDPGNTGAHAATGCDRWDCRIAMPSAARSPTVHSRCLRRHASVGPLASVVLP